MKNAVIAALVVALAVSIAAGVIAGASRTMNVEVRVWQDVNEPDALWLSARPDGGSWSDLGTIPVPLDDGLSGTGRYRYGDVVLTLSLPPPPSCAEPSLAPDCAILLAARDALAGDGALNWSADLPLTEWEGVTVSGTPRRVTGLDLRNRGLTGTIPPELGSLPPTLATLHLAGNAFTGCVPERLRLAENDLEQLMAERTLGHCRVPDVHRDGEALPPGTYHLDGWIIVDIPVGDLKVDLCGYLHADFASPEDIPEGQSNNAVCFGDLDRRWEMWLDAYYAVEWGRYSADPDMPDQALPAEWDAVFDQIAATARRMPPPSCAEAALAPDCAILLVVRDTLAGDGALNWSPDIPVEEWYGVSVSRSSRRVTWLSVVNRGLTGRIPPEMGDLTALRGLALSGNSLTGSVPPELEKLLPGLDLLYLSGNSFTGCVSERLRLVPLKDLAKLQGEIGFSWCPVAAMPDGGATLAPGTYQIEGNVIVDIPEGGPQVRRNGWKAADTEEPGISGYADCFSDIEGRWGMCLDTFTGKEWGRRPHYQAPPLSAEMDAVFDAIVASARPAPPAPPSCAEPSLAPDCAVLLAARAALAGDGALNWSADAPVAEWDGVALSGTPWRVTELDLRNRGLTGTIPPELGNLPPTLSIYLTGNAFTGCIPERLRLARIVREHGLDWCPVATIPSATVLSAGTYQFDVPHGMGAIIDIPAEGPQIALTRKILGDSGISYCFTTPVGENRICLDEVSGVETLRRIDPDFTDDNVKAVNALFDAIAASARRAPR